jgi:hypothetical protein
MLSAGTGSRGLMRSRRRRRRRRRRSAWRLRLRQERTTV